MWATVVFIIGIILTIFALCGYFEQVGIIALILGFILFVISFADFEEALIIGFLGMVYFVAGLALSIPSPSQVN